jgi:hypothetical protein
MESVGLSEEREACRAVALGTPPAIQPDNLGHVCVPPIVSCPVVR